MSCQTNTLPHLTLWCTTQVLGIEGDECRVRFDGPPPIGMGVKAAIKDKFPDIRTVTLVA